VRVSQVTKVFMADNTPKFSQGSTSDIVGYEDFLADLKTRISNAQLRAVVAV